MYIKHKLKPWALERKKNKGAENLDFHPQSKNYVVLVLAFKENSISIARSLGLSYKVVRAFKAQMCLLD